MNLRWPDPGIQLSLLRRALVLLFLFALAGTAAAQANATLRFKRLGALGSDELSVVSLLQDRQGYIWIGTHSGGLYRYDGHNAIKYTHHPGRARSLPHDRVSALFQDRQGRIWAGTQNGLARYDPATNDFTTFAPPSGPPARLIIKSIVPDPGGGMWLATWGGLHHFDPDSGAFRGYLHDAGRPDSLSSNDLNAIALDHKGGLWIGTWPGGLDYLAPGARGFAHYRVDDAAAPDAKLNIVRSLMFDAARTLWIGTEAGMVRWDTGAPWRARARLPGPVSRVAHIVADRTGTVWAGTVSAGLLRWDKGGGAMRQFINRASDPHSLPSNNIPAVMQDSSGMLWIASFTDGIAMVNLNSRSFEHIIPFDTTPDNPVPNNSLQAIAGAGGDRLWLATNTGLALFDRASGRALRHYRADPGKPGALSHNMIYSLHRQEGGPLWVGTSAGLNRLAHEDARFEVVNFGKGGADFINTIAPGAPGKLWLGTGRAVFHYDIARGDWTSYAHDERDPHSRSVDGSTCIVEDRQGRVWMGSEWSAGGLDMLDKKNGRFRHFRHAAGDPASLSDDNVSSLYEDARGRVWAGTAKGLDQVVTGADGRIRFRRHSAQGSVGQLKILAIRGDAAGMLWLSTASGLLRLDPESGKVERFRSADGVSQGFTPGSSHTAPNGVLYFGGVKGMTAVEPGAVRKVSFPPQVAITDVRVQNRSLWDGPAPPGVRVRGPLTAPAALTLDLRQTVISFEFAALHYTDPARNSYRYRLAGFDRDWVPTDAAHRNATYTNLDPGSYVFEVRAANDQGIWGARAARVELDILPAFWQSWWFRLLAGAFVLGALALTYRLRIGLLTQQRQHLRALVRERTRELEESNIKLARLSTTDALTGITNRRGFDEALAREWQRAKRNGEPLALAMLDVDWFKHYNDHYGHQAGDQCLRAVAELIAAHARRTSDLVARYGGEEFTLLAPATGLAQMLAIAEEICAALALLGLRHEKSEFGAVTISIGVAAIRPDLQGTPEGLIHAADLALYVAKQNGRNRVSDGTGAPRVAPAGA
ncbi:diguanylate cyclase [Massilia glaciei]|uniref:diguanylate cyclase n=1 Tax=Massilia glaciei TaxID=1524097 RepID=A0A2U2HND6_9BURK|nr:diguanylate cyclase [Massilia glaciei]PWF49017.1 GGDEF domain-containing protein [Massilia glaciei]